MASRTAKPYYELRHPFDEWTIEYMQGKIAEFVRHPGLQLYHDFFERGGLLNLDPKAYERHRKDRIQASEDELKALERENNPKSRFDRFRQTKGLYLLVALCSAAAAGKHPLRKSDEIYQANWHAQSRDGMSPPSMEVSAIHAMLLAILSKRTHR